MSETAAPALKEIFNEARYRAVADHLATIHKPFDREAFLKFTLAGLDELNLMQRLRRMTEGFHHTLPGNFPKAVSVLKKLATRIDSGFATLVLPDFVALYGQEHFEDSMDALKFFTPFGSSEFAIRYFLRNDLKRTLAVMKEWSKDENEHVRRLASEGCRPRLPWSFKLEAIIQNPDLTAPILENLRADPSLYVRKSVANHLNDITKDQPKWVLDRVKIWPLDQPHTQWIVRHALRTLIKKGDKEALTIMGAGEKALLKVELLKVAPKQIALGEKVTFTLDMVSTSTSSQKLVIDYVIHYVKKSGQATPKVFKWKEITLLPSERLALSKSQTVKDFTTRTHHPGRHVVQVMINGEQVAQAAFDLTTVEK